MIRTLPHKSPTKCWKSVVAGSLSGCGGVRSGLWHPLLWMRPTMLQGKRFSRLRSESLREIRVDALHRSASLLTQWYWASLAKVGRCLGLDWPKVMKISIHLGSASQRLQTERRVAPAAFGVRILADVISELAKRPGFVNWATNWIEVGQNLSWSAKELND